LISKKDVASIRISIEQAATLGIMHKENIYQQNNCTRIGGIGVTVDWGGMLISYEINRDEALLVHYTTCCK
jgi:hypothetical protein